MSDKSSNRSSAKTAKRRSPPGLKHPITVAQNEFNRHGNAVAEALAQFNLIAGNTVGGIFFDNDHDKITQVKEYCGNIVGVEVPESKCRTSSKNIKTELLSVNPSAFNTANNVYFQLHEHPENKKIGVKHIFYDSKAGIRKEHIKILKNWILDTQHLETRYAFFDWDRTLAMNEGLIIPLLNPPPKNIADAYRQFHIVVPDNSANRVYEDMSIYLAGGNKRLKMLRNMFDMLHDRNIQIVILTNNGACINENQTEYYKNLARKFVGYDDIEFVCSLTMQDPAKLEYDMGNKGFALASNPDYQAVCKGALRSAGGRRRHKTRRHK